MISLFKVYMSPLAVGNTTDTLRSGYLTQGPKVEQFEKNLCSWLCTTNLLTVNSATNGLQLAIKLSGVESGDYVISTAFTCSATNTAIRANGGHIIWADIDKTTGNILPESIEDRLREDKTGRIKAIMIVDWGGLPCDLQEISRIAKQYGVKVIRDAAHSFGALYNGDFVSGLVDYTVFSFQAIKHLTTADGGALVCKSESDYKRGKLLRWFGIDREAPPIDPTDLRCSQDISEPGFKYHMNDVNATIGIENLKDMNYVVNKHKANGQLLDAFFREKQFTTIIPLGLNARTPPSNDETIPTLNQSAYWIYTVLVEDRKAFMEFMYHRDIMTSQVHSRNDLWTMFKPYWRELPNTDYITARQVNIPCGWWLTDSDLQYIMGSIHSYDKVMTKTYGPNHYILEAETGHIGIDFA